MKPFLHRIREPGACLFGTWAKLGSLETLEMLAWAAHGVAMVGSAEAVQTAADAVTDDVAHDGAAVVLRALLDR